MDEILTVIQAGDQYGVRFKVKEDDVEITPENCDDMQIKIDDIIFMDNSIDFIDGWWICFVTQEMTLRWSGIVQVQAHWRYTDGDKTNIKHTAKAKIHIDSSIFEEAWL